MLGSRLFEKNEKLSIASHPSLSARAIGISKLISISLNMPKAKKNSGPAKEFSDTKTAPLQENSSLLDASRKMRDLKTSSFPVAAGEKLVGELSGSDQDRAVAGFGHDPATTKVKENMSSLEHYCHQDVDIREAMALMQKHKLRHLPVVDQKMRIVGILDWKKIAPLSKQKL